MKNFGYKWRYFALAAALLSTSLQAVNIVKDAAASSIAIQGEVIELINAAGAGNLSEVKRLVTRGVAINAQDSEGRTALHHAAKVTDDKAKGEVLHYLIESGASLEIKDTRGFTPLDGLDPQLLSDLLNTVYINSHESFKADISYLFADCKYDGEKLKILELGEGKNGGYRTWDGVFEKGLIWKGFWNYAANFDIPLIYVGKLPSNHAINKIGITLQDKVAWSTFKEHGGTGFSSLRDLERSSFFNRLAKDEKEFDERSIKSYKGILVYKYRDDREPRHLRELESFKKRFPQFLVIDGVSRPFAANKELTDILFDDDELRQFRPQTRVYKKRYSRGLAERINNDFNCNKYVIKPLNSGMSNGVVVVPKKKLDKALRRITRNTDSAGSATYNYRPTSTTSWGYWKGDRNPGFIVEEYVPSKLLTVHGRRFDPTIRMVFVVHHDEGRIAVNFLESWWKIPTRSLDDNCCLTQKHVSQFRGDLKTLPPEKMRIADEDMSDLKTLMRDMLPKMFLKMLKIRKEMQENHNE